MKGANKVFVDEKRGLHLYTYPTLTGQDCSEGWDKRRTSLACTGLLSMHGNFQSSIYNTIVSMTLINKVINLTVLDATPLLASY